MVCCKHLRAQLQLVVINNVKNKPLKRSSKEFFSLCWMTHNIVLNLTRLIVPYAMQVINNKNIFNSLTPQVMSIIIYFSPYMLPVKIHMTVFAIF